MVLPNFLIVGAAKAGITSLYHYLKQHPKIYMSPVKEPRFFAPEFFTTHSRGFVRDSKAAKPLMLEQYQELFSEVDDEEAIGEASTEYLYFAKAPSRIKKYIPDAKIIIVLRNPLERAYSAYCYQLRDGCETLSFKEAIRQEEKRKAEGWRPGWLYKDSSLYCKQIRRYFEVFDRKKIQIYLNKDLRQNTNAVVTDICRFLNVSEDFDFDQSPKNASYIPKNVHLNRFINRNPRLKKIMKSVLPSRARKFFLSNMRSSSCITETVSETTRAEMSTFFEKDILCLEKLIDKDLSHWLLM